MIQTRHLNSGETLPAGRYWESDLWLGDILNPPMGSLIFCRLTLSLPMPACYWVRSCLFPIQDFLICNDGHEGQCPKRITIRADVHSLPGYRHEEEFLEKPLAEEKIPAPRVLLLFLLSVLFSRAK